MARDTKQYEQYELSPQQREKLVTGSAWTNVPISDHMTSPSVLRVLVAGIDRLYDGDLKDRETADTAIREIFRTTGWIVTRSGACRAHELSEGYVREGVSASQRYNGEWVDSEGMTVAEGTCLYLDPECEILVRSVG